MIDLGAGRGQRLGDRAPDAFGRAGDQRHLARQIEHHHLRHAACFARRRLNIAWLLYSIARPGNRTTARS